MPRTMQKIYDPEEQGPVPAPDTGAETGGFLIHENRLQRLEESRVEVAAQLATTSSALTEIARSTKEGFERMEAWHGKIGGQIEALSTSNQARDKKIEEMDKVLEKRERHRAWLRKNAITIVIGLVGACAGVFGKSLGEVIVAALK
jgi:hypothetical protein